jgi:(p)ppGpp synthase/HD superfamily hydrolase
MTPRYTQALTLAATAHEGQNRKSTRIPYITHPVAVAALVASYDGDEDQQIAALLHDVLEDGGPQWAAPIQAQFGERVLSMVQACTDGVPDITGVKPPWKERKVAYLAHLAGAPDDVLLVSACDKLHNILAIAHDLDHIGSAVFGRFNAGQDQVLWYYEQLADIFTARQVAPAAAIKRTFAQIAAHITTADTVCRGNMQANTPAQFKICS